MSAIKHIVIASVLKPINDTRMYEKFGLTLKDNPSYHIHIIGFASPIPQEHPRISFYPIFSFSRLSIRRLLVQVKYARILLKVKPEVIIVNAPELLIVTTAFRVIFGSKIIYDVQENYYRNITKTEIYPPVIRNILGSGLRGLEWLLRPFIAHFTLAERNYEQEFSFTKGKSTILENKFKLPEGMIQPTSSLNNPRQKLLFSGTLSYTTGVFEAIKMAKAFYAFDQSVTLTIIGYAAQKEVYNELINSCVGHPYIKIVGGDRLVPHSDILKAISEAGTGLVCYRPSPSTENCIPTKMFEYAAFQLPMIVQNNPLWEAFSKDYNAAIITNFSKTNTIDLVFNDLLNTKFYNNSPLFSDQLLWNTKEYHTFLKLITNLAM